MRYLIISLIFTFCLTSYQIAYAGIAINSPKTELIKKKDKKIKRIAKKIKWIAKRSMDPFLGKGIVSMILGILSIAALVTLVSLGVLNASLLMILAGPILSAILSTLAISIGIQAVMDDADYPGFGIAGIVMGGISTLAIIILALILFL